MAGSFLNRLRGGLAAQGALAVLVTLGACGALGACGGATSHTVMADPATLLAERDEWRGERAGPVMLRMHVEALVDTRPDPSKATSAIVVHFVAADYREGGAAPLEVTVPVPRGATLASSDVRLVDGAGARPATLPSAPAPRRSGTALAQIDPEQDALALTLPAAPTGGVVEAILRFDVPGTLVSDARFLGLEGMPVAELLLRYDLATDTVGGFQTTLPNARPVVTEKDGRRLIALFAQRLAPVVDRAAPHARYVTVRAAPKGFAQTWSADWATATAAYRRDVVEAGGKADAGYEVPYQPTGTGRPQVLDALAWVRARPMRAGHADPFDVRWDTARGLPAALRGNDLTAVDRVHLLAWLLREAGVAFSYVMARSATRPPLDPAFATPGAFDAPLVHVSDLDLVLDPACDACAPGEVRPSLRGGQALKLPAPAAKSATFITLPASGATP